jgi:hypothetical protein
MHVDQGMIGSMLWGPDQSVTLVMAERDGTLSTGPFDSRNEVLWDEETRPAVQL